MRALLFVAVAASVFLRRSSAQIDGRVNTAGFPVGFQWGAATASYQIEGGWDADGKTPSIWDNFTQSGNGNTFEDATADIADDHYHLFREDVARMADLGLTAYRFSISWSRVIKDGNGEVNEPGIQFYSDLIDELLANGITPHVTLYHWDLPQALQEQYGGWISADDIRRDWQVYARLCFERFGDRVKDWFTFNEPQVFVFSGYGSANYAPALSVPEASIEIPRSVVLCNAFATKILREEFPEQNGKIGMAINSNWNAAWRFDSEEDIAAAERKMISELGFWADPVFFGDYGEDLKAIQPSLIGVFSEDEKELLRSYTPDFFGLNSYSTRYVEAQPDCTDSLCAIMHTADPDDIPVGAQTASGFLLLAPWGFRPILNWVSERYGQPIIHVTENGYADSDVPLNRNNGVTSALQDAGRIQQLTTYLENMRRAIVDDGVNVQGYFHWSFMDNFEWRDAFSKRFGLVYVDFESDPIERPRSNKDSFTFYKRYIASAIAHANKSPVKNPDEVLN